MWTLVKWARAISHMLPTWDESCQQPTHRSFSLSHSLAVTFVLLCEIISIINVTIWFFSLFDRKFTRSFGCERKSHTHTHIHVHWEHHHFKTRQTPSLTKVCSKKMFIITLIVNVVAWCGMLYRFGCFEWVHFVTLLEIEYGVLR